MTKTYFDNSMATPEDFSFEERMMWRALMLGAASVHVPTEIWDRLRKDQIKVVMDRRVAFPTEATK